MVSECLYFHISPPGRKQYHSHDALSTQKIWKSLQISSRIEEMVLKLLVPLDEKEYFLVIDTKKYY